MRSDERKIPVGVTLSPQHVEFIDEQVAAKRFATRSAAIDFAIYLFARSEIERKSKDPQETFDEMLQWIGRLQQENELLSQNLENAMGDAREEWNRANTLGSKALELAGKVKKLEARIEALEATKAEAAD